MNSHYTYLLLNFGSIIFPFILSFDKKVAFYKLWKFLFPSIIIVASFFIGWDYLFTLKGVWNFNPQYITGLYLFNLPIEEVLFFITVPYSCVFIYEVCNAYFKRDVLGACGKKISVLFSVICLIGCIIYYDKLYTIINLSTCMVFVLLTTFAYQFKNLGRFYLSYFLSLIPFLIVNGLLTSLPIVSYNDAENMGFRLYTIPIEDVFYCLSLLLSCVILMDIFKERFGVNKKP